MLIPGYVLIPILIKQWKRFKNISHALIITDETIIDYTYLFKKISIPWKDILSFELINSEQILIKIRNPESHIKEYKDFLARGYLKSDLKKFGTHIRIHQIKLKDEINIVHQELQKKHKVYINQEGKNIT